jgi:hypothetical protein
LRSVRVAATYEKVGLTPRYSRTLYLSIFEQPPIVVIPASERESSNSKDTNTIEENKTDISRPNSFLFLEEAIEYLYKNTKRNPKNNS